VLLLTWHHVLLDKSGKGSYLKPLKNSNNCIAQKTHHYVADLKICVKTFKKGNHKTNVYIRLLLVYAIDYEMTHIYAFVENRN